MSSAAAEKSNRNGIVGGRTPQRQTIEPGGMGEWRLSEPNFAAKDFIAPTLSNPLGDARIGKVSPRRVRLRIGRSLYRPRYLWYRRLLPFRRVGRLVHVLTPLPGQANFESHAIKHAIPQPGGIQRPESRPFGAVRQGPNTRCFSSSQCRWPF
jgi:hypothetical protein